MIASVIATTWDGAGRLPLMPAEDSWIAAPKLGAVRDAKLWSQYELAKRSGVSRNTINRLEAGKKAQRRTIRALAEALGVEASALLAEPG